MNFYELTIALLIININDSFANSYRLVNVISRKFEVMNFTEVIKQLKEAELVTAVDKGGVSYFEITEKGYQFIANNKAESLAILRIKFPNESNFINAMEG